MKSNKKDRGQQSFLMNGLAEMLDPRQPLKKLAEKIPWERFEEGFSGLYSNTGRPAKPVRLMVGLLLLKQIENLSDEAVVERWAQNPYYQYFCGMEQFQWTLPCDPTDLIYFRKRIGESGAELIMAVSASMHGDRLEEDEVVVDTTVQEKNITFPTDTKLYRKIIERCWKLADDNDVKLRRRYRKEVKRCLTAQRFRRRPNQKKVASKAQRKLKTLAGRLIRELKRKLPKEITQAEKENLALYQKVLAQKKPDKNKVYSLHEPDVYCVSKGKEHKKYEFGCKSSIAMTKTHGVIVAAQAHRENAYDGHTLPEVLEKAEAVMECGVKKAIVDRGYRGRQWIGETEVLIPEKPKTNQSRWMKTKMRKRFRRRAAIEPLIGHLKSDFGLRRTYLKGQVGDQINLLLSCAAWNIRKFMRELLFWLQYIQDSLRLHISTLLKTRQTSGSTLNASSGREHTFNCALFD